MKTIEELIDSEDSGWSLVCRWIADAQKPCEVLAVREDLREGALLALQVTTRSPMGAIVYKAAGLFIDKGWLRVLGSGGNSRLNRSLPDWNRGKSEGFLLVADDAIGGCFAINGGGLGGDVGQLYYLAPDTLKWEACHLSYSQFIVWSLSSRLDEFYSASRWPGWEKEASTISGDEVIMFYPFLWAEAVSIESRDRRPISAEENYGLLMDFGHRLPRIDF